MITKRNHNAVLLGVILIAAYQGAHGQFPMACKANITERIGTCCPNPNGHINACGYPDRGICEELPQTNVNYYPRVADDIQDDRFNWPHAYVQKGCRCYGNFYGPDCSECMWGWSGSRCDVKDSPRERRNIMDYNWREKRIFRDTLQRAKVIPSGLGAVFPTANFSTDVIRMEELSIYDMYIWFHYRTSHQPLGSCTAQPFYNFAHGGPHFGIWHRLYMLWIEKRLRSVSEDHHFMLPYWDWIDAENCTVCTNDLVGANNDTDPNGRLETESPFYSWDTRCPRVENNTADLCGLCDPTVSSGKIQRNVPEVPSNLTNRYPSAAWVRLTLERRQFSLYDPLRRTPTPIFPIDFIVISRDFTGALESIHGTVHAIQSGTMGSVMISPNDPMFLLHHTFVDKLLEVWFKKFGIDKTQYPYSSYPMGTNAEEPMVPLYPQEQIIDYFQYGDDLGYKYDTLCLSYENETECPRQTEVPTSTAKEPSTTSSPTKSTSATTTTTTSSAHSTTSTIRVPGPPADVSDDDRDLWKGLAIASFTISVILLVILGVALILSLVRMRKAPYIVREKEPGVNGIKTVSSKQNGIANPSCEIQNEFPNEI